MDRPRIVCAGMCDTKGREIRFLAEMVAAHGGDPIILDLSLGAAVDWADIPLDEVLASNRTPVEAVVTAPRAAAVELVGRAGASKVLELRSQGRCDGIISWAGSVGTSVATAVMRALPFGVPKVMLTDMASSDVSQWLGETDIYIANPGVEQGINAVSRRAVANAAAGVVAMAAVPEPPPSGKRLCAVTSYGTTTPCVLRCVEAMERSGWETAVFHSVGAGATMEDLIRAGRIDAVLDVTLGELVNTLLHTPFGMPRTWGGDRLTAAAHAGIPQVLAPGGLDQVALGPLSTVPSEYLAEVRAGRRHSWRDSGLPYQHNDGVTILASTPDEIGRISEEIAAKLGRTTGPTAFVVPMRGWSAYDQPEALATRERGWAAGNGDGPTWEPDPAQPEWSRRATRMLEVLSARLDPANEQLDLIAVDMHLLDPGFADLLLRCLGDMLEGSWRKGRHLEVPGVIDSGARA